MDNQQHSHRGNELMKTTRHHAFSLVEVLAAVTIIGIITFLAIPNIVRVKQDGEDNLARSRAETLNMAVASLIQAQGATAAQAAWTGASDDDARYASYLKPYLAFAETNLSSYMPSGYSVVLPSSINPPSKVTLKKNGVAVAY